jgi:hypothetical protein
LAETASDRFQLLCLRAFAKSTCKDLSAKAEFDSALALLEVFDKPVIGYFVDGFYFLVAACLNLSRAYLENGDFLSEESIVILVLLYKSY